jgi:hypothetical protein
MNLSFSRHIHSFKFIHHLDTNCQILMELGFMECVMEEQNTVVVFNFMS